MPDARAIVEWYKNTGLRPYLDLLPEAERQAVFLNDYTARLEPLYPVSYTGGVAFPFRRVFIAVHV